MRIWIDSEIILDCMYEREGFEDSLMVLKLCEARKLDGCISAATLLRISQAIEEQLSINSKVSVINDIARIFNIVDVGIKDFDFEAISKFDSFEKGFDAVCARNANSRYIVTHDTKGYDDLEIVAIHPNEIEKLTEISRETMYIDPVRSY